MAIVQQAWIDSLQREAGFRRAIILHGDILDVYPSPRNNQDYVPIQPIVCTTLRAKGFSDIILWDSFEGVKNVKAARWEELQKEMLSPASVEKKEDSPNNTYDMGDVSLEDTPQNAQGAVPPNIDDFLAVVHFYMTHKQWSKLLKLRNHWVFQT